jgi:hypothetical protein
VTNAILFYLIRDICGVDSECVDTELFGRIGLELLVDCIRHCSHFELYIPKTKPCVCSMTFNNK